MADGLRILSIDGGGIRGIIPALLLTRLEELTGRPIASSFELIAGTSTGGLLALALSAPDPTAPSLAPRPRWSATELVDLYERDGPKIFSRPLWRRVRSGFGLLDESYPSDGLERALRERLGDARLSDALTEVLVTAYDLEARRPLFFKRHRAIEDPARRDFLMRDAGFATSAAPTYFEPHQVSAPDGSSTHTLVDGGVFASNPAVPAVVEALKKREPRVGVDELFVVSLGTGHRDDPIAYADARGWGKLQWVRPLIDVVFDGQSDATDHSLRVLLNGPGDLDGSSRAERPGYVRFQARLDRGEQEMDDASPGNLAALRRRANELIEANEAELQAVADRILTR